MDKKPYTSPKLADRGKIAEETMQSDLPTAFESNGIVKTDGMAI